MPKMWTVNCKEQKYLEKLLRDNEIHVGMKPSEIQRKYPIFGGFTQAVFRKHWNKTKMKFDPTSEEHFLFFKFCVIQWKYALLLGGVYGDGENDDDIVEIDGPGAGPSSSAGASTGPPKKIVRLNEGDNEHNAQQVVFKQPPVITSVFADPDTKQMKCLVIVLFFSNVKNIDFDIVPSERGQLFKISYEWPRIAYVVEEMFTRDGDFYQ